MFSKIFKTKDNVATEQVPTNVNSSTTRREGETYKQWGTRWAGQTSAAIIALKPALQVVVCQQKNEQLNDEQLQERARIQKQQKIQGLEAEINTENDSKQNLENEITTVQEQIREKENEIIEIKGGGNKNGIAKINFWFGCCISALLAIYLFIFYSSASYSAFFRKGDNLEVGNALFYPKAFEDAWNTSIGNFLLILLMPVIFLGLGFLVHQFSSRSQNKSNLSQLIGKYIKILTLYAVTFVFDALLAYEISKKMYEIEILNLFGDFPPYSMSMAFNSPEFWIIIFAGFIAYIIWGLVFDFTMEAYSDMTENKNILNKLQTEIFELKKRIEDIKHKIAECQAKIQRLRGEITQIEEEIRGGTYTIDTLRVKQELNNFLQGWLGYMNLMAMPESAQAQAQQALDEIIEQL